MVTWKLGSSMHMQRENVVRYYVCDVIWKRIRLNNIWTRRGSFVDFFSFVS